MVRVDNGLTPFNKTPVDSYPSVWYNGHMMKEMNMQFPTLTETVGAIGTTLAFLAILFI